MKGIILTWDLVGIPCAVDGDCWGESPKHAALSYPCAIEREGKLNVVACGD